MKSATISNVLRSKWVLLSILTMLASGFYLFLFINAALHVGYIGVEENFRYWLLFPYDDTYLTALVSVFLFIACGFIVIARFTKPHQTLRKNFLVSGWIIIGVIGTVVFCGFMLLLSTVGGVARLDTI